MGRAKGPSGRSIVIALLVGLAVLLLLFPGSGTAAQPPTCYSLIGYLVPCEGWVAPVAAVASAALVGLAAWQWIDRRRRQ